MKHLLLSLLAVATLSAAQGKQTFTGTITDDRCGKAGHAQMQMGPTDPECTLACISAHGATYVLYDGKVAYYLSTNPQANPKFRPSDGVLGNYPAAGRTIVSELATTRE